jgi:hypothetical protein
MELTLKNSYFEKNKAFGNYSLGGALYLEDI